MGIGSKLADLREKHQEQVDETTSDIAVAIFPREEDPEACLRRVERNSELPAKEVAERILNHYAIPLTKQAQILSSYKLGELLTELAAHSGYTKKHIAKSIGFSYHHFLRILAGSRAIRSPEKLLDFCRVVGADHSTTRQLFRLAHIENFDPLAIEKTNDANNHERLVTRLREALSSTTRPERDQGIDLLSIVDPDRSAAIGQAGIVNLAAQLARRAGGGHNNTLRISLGNRFASDPHLVSLLLNTVRDLLLAGVDIKWLVPAPSQAQEIFEIVTGSLSLLAVENGNFTLHWDPAGNQGNGASSSTPQTAPAQKMVLLENGSCLLFLPKESDPTRDSAMIVDDQRGLFRKHFDRRFDQGQELFKLHRASSSDPTAFQEAIVEAESDPGPRLIIRRRPPNTMIPMSLWKWESNQISSSESFVRSLSGDAVDPWRFERLATKKLMATNNSTLPDCLDQLKLWKVQRLERMMEALQRDHIREIYPESSIRLFFKNQEIEKRVRLGIVQQLRIWLERYDNYHIGFSPGGALTSTAFFGVHGSRSVFLSVWRASEDADYLQVKHPLFVEAFKDYFISQWKTLPPKDRRKKDVLEKLKDFEKKIESE